MIQIFKTIQGKQLMLAVTVSVIPLIVVGFIINALSLEQIHSDVRGQLHQVISDKAHSVEQWIDERKSDIHLLASTNYVISLVKGSDARKREANLRSFYDKFAGQYGVYRSTRILDREGRVVFTYPEQVASEPQWSLSPDPEPGQSVVSEAFLWNGDACFLIASSITSDSEVLGKVIVVTDLEDLNGITDNIRIGETGEAYIVNSAGFFVTHKEKERVLVECIDEVEPIARLLSGEETSFVGEFVDYRGVAVLGTYYYFRELDWGLVAEQDVKEAFAPAQRVNATILLIIIVSSVLVAGIAYVLTTGNLSPLALLRRAIERIRKGELDARFPVQRHDEIGVIGKVFNDMLEQLQSTQDKLEKRAEAADKELVQAHEELHLRHKELKRAQTQLLRAERLSTMGEIAAGLAHEINNPLTTIIMLINSLGRVGEDGVDLEERKRALGIIAEEIEKVASMVGRFMDLTHPQEMRREPIVIEKVVDRTLALVRPKTDQAGINVEVVIPHEIPSVVGDDRQLGQLLLNLLLNSIDALPEGGEISIAASAYTNKEEGKRYLRLRVSDNGLGIPQKKIGKIFNPFFTTKSAGTGLGLTIVARIVESHGGHISVRSTPAAGTTFFVDLPESGGHEPE